MEMKLKMKRVTAMLLVGGLCLFLISCGKLSDQTELESSVVVTEGNASDVPRVKDDNLPSIGDSNVQKSSEEYVYDYQVSMDPIPKEIADLGGPCQGTIHAFPSKIEIGLTQKMMEEDPELKAEVEKRIPEVEQSLAENIGGEFRVDGVIAEDILDWYWFCTEISTGYEFSLRYTNNEYFWAKETGYTSGSENDLLIEDYYNKKNSENQEEVYSQLIENSFNGSLNSIWVENDETYIMLFIIQFTDNDVDKTDEQLKLLKLWNDINDHNGNCSYYIDMRYFPTDYRDVMEHKFYYGEFYDRSIDYDEALLENGELIARLRYVEGFEEENEKPLDLLLEEYESNNDNKDFIWSYWR